jgi:hypothetical protein
MAPPSGQTAADLPPDVNHVPYAMSAHAVLTSITLVVVAFRCVSRIKTTGLKADDYCMLIAMVGTTSTSTLQCADIGIGVCHSQLRFLHRDLPPHGTTHYVSGCPRDLSCNAIAFRRRVCAPTGPMSHQNLRYHLPAQHGGTKAMAPVDALLQHAGYLRVNAGFHCHRLDTVQASSSELGPEDFEPGMHIYLISHERYICRHRSVYTLLIPHSQRDHKADENVKQSLS